MRIVGKVAVMALLFFCFFSCSDDEVEKKEEKIREKLSTLTPKITKIDMEPAEPTSSGFVRAIPGIEYGDKKNIAFKYQWFVNDKAVPKAEKAVLDKKHFKKGDTVYCKVQAVRGKLKSEEVESGEVKIGNSPPVIEPKEVGSFDVPGEFRYHISASDPDGDALSYRLVSPLDRDIELDPDTGVIKWLISEVPGDFREGQEEQPARPEDEEGSSSHKETGDKASADSRDRPSPIVRIVYEVRDSDGAATTASITLNLALRFEEAH